MDKKRKSRLSVILFKRQSKINELLNNNSTKKISIKKLYETFKESPVDFAILQSIMKLAYPANKNSNNERRNELISIIFDNMKKKKLIFFFSELL